MNDLQTAKTLIPRKQSCSRYAAVDDFICTETHEADGSKPKGIPKRLFFFSRCREQQNNNNNKSFWPTQPGGRAVSLFIIIIIILYLFNFFFSFFLFLNFIKFISKLIFATDARELGARDVAPDALLVKLPKKKRKIKRSKKSNKITKIERKSLWTLAVTSQCRITRSMASFGVGEPP